MHALIQLVANTCQDCNTTGIRICYRNIFYEVLLVLNSVFFSTILGLASFDTISTFSCVFNTNHNKYFINNNKVNMNMGGAVDCDWCMDVFFSYYSVYVHSDEPPLWHPFCSIYPKYTCILPSFLYFLQTYLYKVLPLSQVLPLPYNHLNFFS